MSAVKCWLIVSGIILSSVGQARTAEIPSEFRIKRKGPYEFAVKPTIVREGQDKVVIRFKTKAFCDVTVAIEDHAKQINGHPVIIRHLASGVLGANAPRPFQKNSLEQTLIWDGKNDQGRYVDAKKNCVVRVSLGLKPRFEKTLYWSPHKRVSDMAPIIAPAPEGVYVFEGMGRDHLRLFTHQGEYLRTIYPFPRAKLDQVKGLGWHSFPQGETLPLKIGNESATLLTSGTSSTKAESTGTGSAAMAMALFCRKGKPARIALAYHRLNRLTGDSDTGGFPLTGPRVCVSTGTHKHARRVAPTSAAFSPDGKTLYLTGYVYKNSTGWKNGDCRHMVGRVDYESDKPVEVWLGQNAGRGGYGKGNDQFCVPSSVDCDAKGRVYISDYINNRIQVYSPEGTYLKTIPVRLPAVVKVNPKTGEIWAFSMRIIGPSPRLLTEDMRFMPPTVSRLGTFEKPKKTKPQPLPNIPSSSHGGKVVSDGQTYQVAVDWYADEPTIWIVGRQATLTAAEGDWIGGSGFSKITGGWEKRGINLLRLKNGKWQTVRDFARVAAGKVKRVLPSAFARVRLYVNPVNGLLTCFEDITFFGKSCHNMLIVDPDTGVIREQKLPFDAEDICYDLDGHIYLRTQHEVVRYDSQTWREIPWDYGVERAGIRFIANASGPSADAVSALPIPGCKPVWWHSSGMWVSPRKNLAIINYLPRGKRKTSHKDNYLDKRSGTTYRPLQYPGRSGDRLVMVFDKYGKVIHKDAIPGMTNCDGLGIDKDDNLYFMIAAPRILNRKKYFDGMSETLTQFPAGKGKLLSTGRASIPLAKEARPERSPDFGKYNLGETWAQDAEWLYGGVGYGGIGGGCTCWHSRFQLDYFARSFAPEVRRFRVAVLDSAGNLIMRIGQYGNVEDGVPAGGPGQKGEPPNQRRVKQPVMGGNVDDQVCLVNAAYVGVHTDRRLYIHDAGNDRIVCVKLDYYTEETIPLK
jgi:hypothetical protein